MHTAIRSIAKAAREKRLVSFCGAGISMLAPSRSPSWWEIYFAAVCALRDRFEEGFPEFSEKIQVEELLQHFQTQKLADIIVTEFAGETFVERLKVVDVADPNENHVLITALAAEGLLKGIVTTNWDTILERTAALKGSRYQVIIPGIISVAPIPNATPLLKLHGSAIDAFNLKETFSHKIREVSHVLRSAWLPMIDGADLLVMGFSGADINYGAVHIFFEDFIRKGGNIWWLHRPDAAPVLPAHIASRTVLIEGSLPFFLQDLAAALDVKGFATPVTERNAQEEIRIAMDTWSEEPYIGKWAAAKFFLSLTSKQDLKNNSANSLYTFLIQLAVSRATAMKPGSTISIPDAIVECLFLGGAGMQAFKYVELEKAEMILKSCLNTMENIHKIMEEDPATIRSRPERLMNLASEWGNYGHILQVQGNHDKAIDAFFKSLSYSYLGGHTTGFLISITNILHYHFQFKNIRGAMHLAEAGIRIGDRTGNVQSSIELRKFLACYHLCRNETYTAEKLLQEAYQLAIAVDPPQAITCKSFQGQVLLKRGKIEQGLTLIADVIAELPTSFINLLSYEELRKFIDIMGIPTESPCFIKLAHADIPAHVSRIEKEITEAQNNNQIPWEGRHCKTYESAGVDKEDSRDLFMSGLYLFDDIREKAIDHSLLKTMDLLNKKKFADALWWVSDILARPSIETEKLAFALICAAHANAGMANLETADQQFKLAIQKFDEAKTEIPLSSTIEAFWFYIQMGDHSIALEWLKPMSVAMQKYPDKEPLQQNMLSHINSHGVALQDIGAAFIKVMDMEPAPIVPGQILEPYLHFRGIPDKGYDQFGPEASAIMKKAEAAIKEKNEEEAWQLIDSILKMYPNGMSLFQLDTCIYLQTEAILITKNVAELDRILEEMRLDFLNDLQFSSLVLLETLTLWKTIQHKDRQLAADIVQKHGFIDEFAIEPAVKARLTCWNIYIDQMQKKTGWHGSRETAAMKAAHFFRIPELAFLRIPDNPDPPKDPCRAILDSFIILIPDCTSIEQLDIVAKEKLEELSKTGVDSRFYKGAVYSACGKWALDSNRYEYALQQYDLAETIFVETNDLSNLLNVMAGKGRTLSRNNQYEQAIDLFEKAIASAGDHYMLPNLLSGLAAAHIIEALERHDHIMNDKIDTAIGIYEKMIEKSEIGSLDKAFARLGIARAYGHKQQQALALRIFDQGVAELAHLGSPYAKLLLENRPQFEEGHWYAMGLG